MKFRKKPVVVEAWCWTGETTPTDAPAWLTAAIQSKRLHFLPYSKPPAAVLALCDGPYGYATVRSRASPGDWIVKGVEGGLYVCDPHTFAEVYEPVTESATP